MSYDPADLTTPETHNLEDLYSKLVERRNKLDRATHFHYFPDENGRYDTLKVGYTMDQDPELNKKLETEVKRRKQPYHIEDWYKYKYYEQFPKISVGWMKFAEKIDEYHRKGKTYFGIQSLDRFDFRDVSYEWWVENYERPNKPCLISGFAEDWPITNWTYETMRTNFLGKEKVKVGKDSSGYRIGFDMKHYLQYVNTQKDDSPVYLFESQLAANDNISKVIDQYKRPVWFNKDLFDYCHAERRPPHRWICVGPERSGTTMHFDPLNTNAWNTVLAGCKLWILFPPDTPEEIAKGKKFQTNPPLDPDIEDEAVGWYHRVYPKLRDWIMKNDNKYGLIEVIQFPGETIFVGGGWWHAVLNINSDTFAVTQNYVNMTNFPAVWRDMRVERKHTAQRWLHNLRYRFPKAYQKALELDKEDGFRPKFQRFPSHCPIPDEELNEDERAIATASHAQLSQKKWESSETPFAYTGWDNVVGGDDSSTDSDSDSSSDSD